MSLMPILAHVTEVESISLAVMFAIGALFGSLVTAGAGWAIWRRKR